MFFLENHLTPDWPAPNHVLALVTTRLGGVSAAPYSGFNLAGHVADHPADVAENRRLLREGLRLPAEPVWLDQVHGSEVIDAAVAEFRLADASHTGQAGVVLAVLTADCLPVLFCDSAGTRIAAAHAGWKGLLAGVLQNTARAMGKGEIMAWLGPAIGPGAFCVGGEVREAFVQRLAGAEAAFQPHGRQWLADLYTLARLALLEAGVERVYGGGLCTWSDAARFYSYRREPVTGRMASLIWRIDL
ncbi:MAG: peptidoglycan editing factor PgeF [Methylococcaceae bacterium]|nr:MAG: peptidoglycan editing factor PgeF [Methylococcaceae bacterium]